jgi:hypothetical protein
MNPTPEEALREIRDREERALHESVPELSRWSLISITAVLFVTVAAGELFSREEETLFTAIGCLSIALIGLWSERDRRAKALRSRYTGRSVLVTLVPIVVMMTAYSAFRIGAFVIGFPLQQTAGAAGMALGFVLTQPWYQRALRASMRRER